MSKKNWIFIKRGLSEDPKHRERMGMAIWLFMHICDAADWETGKVYDWRDKEIGIYQSTPEQLGLMVGMMELAFAPDKDAAKIHRSCIRFLWGYDSTKKMSGPQVKATLDWLAPVKDSGGSYLPDDMAVKELHAVWTAANVEAGQEALPL